MEDEGTKAVQQEGKDDQQEEVEPDQRDKVDPGQQEDKDDQQEKVEPSQQVEPGQQEEVEPGQQEEVKAVDQPKDNGQEGEAHDDKEDQAVKEGKVDEDLPRRSTRQAKKPPVEVTRLDKFVTDMKLSPDCVQNVGRSQLLKVIKDGEIVATYNPATKSIVVGEKLANGEIVSRIEHPSGKKTVKILESGICSKKDCHRELEAITHSASRRSQMIRY